MSDQGTTIREPADTNEVWKGDASGRLAKSLITLIDQVDAMWPNRDRSTDGSIGDLAHQTRASDHNRNADGVVTALDIDRDIAPGFNSRNLVEMLVASRDPRIEYIIANRQIISSRVSPWVWRPYNQDNPHTEHSHISVHNEEALYDDPRPWAIGVPNTQPTGQPAVVSNFDRVHPLIAKWEGGYSNDPADAGGPTNFGITQGRLSESRGHQVSAADVQALTYAEALQIFKRYYWTPLQCDRLPLALATMTYNTGVNSGPKRGAEFLQRVLNRQGAGLDEDGVIGDLTIKAARNCPNIAQAVQDYSAIYEAYYRSLGNFGTFGRGWLNRLNDITPKALAWVSEPLPPIDADTHIPPPPPQTPGGTMPPDTATPYNASIEDCIIELAKAQRPILERYLRTAAPLTDEEKRRLLIMALGGTPPPSAPVLIPPPLTAPPPAAPPTGTAPPVAPPAATSPTTVNISAAIAGVLASLGLSATGVIGAPVGPDATTTGMLLPLISLGAGALGIPAPVVSIIGSLLSKLFAPKT